MVYGGRWKSVGAELSSLILDGESKSPLTLPVMHTSGSVRNIIQMDLSAAGACSPCFLYLCLEKCTPFANEKETGSNKSVVYFVKALKC
jgi:hypothetical protein